jgi:hypothetical protein
MATSMNKTSCATVLKDLTSALELIIVKGNLSSPKIEAARSAMLAVENARNVFDYKGVLSKEESEVDSIFQKHLDTLRGIIATVRSENNEAHQNVVSRVQAFITSLCTCEWRPCVTGVNPQYAVLTNGNEFFISFFGKFRYATRNGYSPSLILGNHEFYPIEATTGCLKFKVTYNFPNVSEERRDIARATLTVPFENGKILWDGKLFSYNVWIGALPTGPSKQIKVTYSWSEVVAYDKKPHRTATVVLNGKDLQSSSSIERKVTFYSTEGYEINKLTVQLYSRAKDSKNELKVVDIAKDHFDVKMKIPAQGNLEFYAEFDESKAISEIKKSVEHKVLTWNQSLELLSDKEFRIEYRTFDGKDYVITAADHTQPYLHVGGKNGKLYLFAVPPQDG